MSLPAAEERAFTGIEQALRSRDPRLSALFSIFTRLTRQERCQPSSSSGAGTGGLSRGRAPGAVALIVCAVVAG